MNHDLHIERNDQRADQSRSTKEKTRKSKNAKLNLLLYVELAFLVLLRVLVFRVFANVEGCLISLF